MLCKDDDMHIYYNYNKEKTNTSLQCLKVENINFFVEEDDLEKARVESSFILSALLIIRGTFLIHELLMLFHY